MWKSWNFWLFLVCLVIANILIPNIDTICGVMFLIACYRYSERIDEEVKKKKNEKKLK